MKSLEVAEKNKYHNLLPEIYANAGYVSQKEGNMAEAENYYNKAIFLSKKYNNKIGLASALRFYGTLYADKSDYIKSLEKAREAKTIADEINDTLISALCLQNFGYIHGKKGNFDSAIFYFQKASDKLLNTRFELIKAKGDLNLCMMLLTTKTADSSILNTVKNAIQLFSKNSEKRGMAQAYGILAMHYYNNGQYEAALLANKTEFNYLLAIKDLQGQCVTLSNTGNNFIQLNKYDSAKVYFNKAIQLAYKLKNEDEITTGLSNLGQVLNHEGEYKLAIEKLNKALEMSKKLESLETTHVLLLRLGNSYLGLRNYQKAIELYSNALKISKEINDLDGQSNNLSKLSDTYEKTGDFKNAFYNLRKYSELNDSLVNVEMFGKLEETEKKYETKIKNDSLKLQANNLLISNQKITTRNRLIGFIVIAFLLISVILFLLFKTYKRTKVAKDKIELLQRELHHRVKNNLAIVARLIEIGGKQTENNLFLKELENRIKSIGILHEQLYQQENITSVNFNPVIQQIFSQINQSTITNNTIKENVRVNVDLETDKAIPLSLIVNELVTNSFKYAFEETPDPTIDLVITKVKQDIILHYKDNGKGLSDKPDANNLYGYGMKLIKGLSSQLSGKYKFWNDTGFNFELVIPV